MHAHLKPALTSYNLLFMWTDVMGWITGFQNKMKGWFDIRICFKPQTVCPGYVHENSISLTYRVTESMGLILIFISVHSDYLDKLKSGMKN